jgi:hypothetical protein
MHLYLFRFLVVFVCSASGENLVRGHYKTITSIKKIASMAVKYTSIRHQIESRVLGLDFVIKSNSENFWKVSGKFPANIL